MIMGIMVYGYGVGARSGTVVSLGHGTAKVRVMDRYLQDGGQVRLLYLLSPIS